MSILFFLRNMSESPVTIPLPRSALILFKILRAPSRQQNVIVMTHC